MVAVLNMHLWFWYGTSYATSRVLGSRPFFFLYGLGRLRGLSNPGLNKTPQELFKNRPYTRLAPCSNPRRFSKFFGSILVMLLMWLAALQSWKAFTCLQGLYVYNLTRTLVSYRNSISQEVYVWCFASLFLTTLQVLWGLVSLHLVDTFFFFWEIKKGLIKN